MRFYNRQHRHYCGISSEKLFSENYAGFRGETVLSVERDGAETGCSIEREGGRLPHAGFQDESPNAQCPGLRLESCDEAPPQTCPGGTWEPHTSV